MHVHICIYCNIYTVSACMGICESCSLLHLFDFINVPAFSLFVLNIFKNGIQRCKETFIRV